MKRRPMSELRDRVLYVNELLLNFNSGRDIAPQLLLLVTPDHHDRGWHITGTAGVFGAAAAHGKLIGLTEQQMVWARAMASRRM